MVNYGCEMQDESTQDDMEFVFRETNSIISEKIFEIIKNGEIKL